MDFSSLFRFPIEYLPFVLLVAMIVFTVHEFAHAFTADKFGDTTPRRMGRVTLNPVPHIDIFGLLLLVIAGFGWARPVLVNIGGFKKPKLMGIIVAAVGPISNLIMAFLSVFLFYLFYHLGWLDKMSLGGAKALMVFLLYMISFNFMLFFFNIIPLPPLDGYLIMRYLLPWRSIPAIEKYEQWAPVIFLLLVFIPPFRHVTIDPLFSLQWFFLDLFNIPMKLIFGHVIEWRQVL